MRGVAGLPTFADPTAKMAYQCPEKPLGPTPIRTLSKPCFYRFPYDHEDNGEHLERKRRADNSPRESSSWVKPSFFQTFRTFLNWWM